MVHKILLEDPLEIKNTLQKMFLFKLHLLNTGKKKIKILRQNKHPTLAPEGSTTTDCDKLIVNKLTANQMMPIG